MTYTVATTYSVLQSSLTTDSCTVVFVCVTGVACCVCSRAHRRQRAVQSAWSCIATMMSSEYCHAGWCGESDHLLYIHLCTMYAEQLTHQNKQTEIWGTVRVSTKTWASLHSFWYTYKSPSHIYQFTCKFCISGSKSSMQNQNAYISCSGYDSNELAPSGHSVSDNTRVAQESAGLASSLSQPRTGVSVLECIFVGVQWYSGFVRLQQTLNLYIPLSPHVIVH